MTFLINHGFVDLKMIVKKLGGEMYLVYVNPCIAQGCINQSSLNSIQSSHICTYTTPPKSYHICTYTTPPNPPIYVHILLLLNPPNGFLLEMIKEN